VHETAPFWSKCAVSFKRKRRQNMLKFTMVLNLYFFQSSSKLQFFI
jgi:hypothetical protein